MAVVGVEWGLIQALAVGTPGPCFSLCVIASLRRQGLQLAEGRGNGCLGVGVPKSSGGHVQGSRIALAG